MSSVGGGCRGLHRVVAAAACIVMVAISTGCVVVPQPVSRRTPQTPAITPRGYRAQLRRSEPIYYKFDLTYDTRRLSEVEGGLQLSEDLATAPFFKRGGGWRPKPSDIKKAYKHPAYKKPLSTWTVYATVRGHYPQTAYVVSKPDRKGRRQLEILQRQSSIDPWLLVDSADLKLGQIRPKTVGHSRVMAPTTDVKVHGLSGDQVINLVDVLLSTRDKAAAARFQHDKLYSWLLTQAPPDATEKHDRSTTSILPATDNYTIPTSDGGMLTFGQFTIMETTTMKDDWYHYFTGQEKRLMPAKGYSSYTYVYILDVVIHSSAVGKLTVVDEGSVWSDLTGTKYPFD